jgi:palmitoyltransferase
MAIVGAWLTVLLASGGLYFLYLTTSADPGFIPLNPTGSSGGTKAGGGSSSGACGGSGKGSIAMQRWDSNGKQQLQGGQAGQQHGRPSPTAGGGSSKSSTKGGGGVLDNPALAAGQWNQLCVSCRIVRPLRAKHCSVTNRCVEAFDHYCPWVGNAIGRGNRHHFLAFLWLELGALLVSTILGVVRIHEAVGVKVG